MKTPEQTPSNKEKLRSLVGDYFTAKENLALSPQGGTESGLDPQDILEMISDLCEEIQPGSTNAHGVVHNSEEDRIISFANKILAD